MRRFLLAGALSCAWFPLLVQAIHLLGQADLLQSWERLLESGQIDEQLVTSTISIVVVAMTIWVSVEVASLIAVHGLGGAIREVSNRTLVGFILLAITSVISGFRGISTERGHSDAQMRSLELEQVTAGMSSAVILSAIRTRRRQQIALCLPDKVPAKLSEESMETAMLLVATETQHLQLSADIDARVTKLCEEIETYENPPADTRTISDLKVVVRLYGFPLVESSQGVLAQFRKARALELISWLVLNRDRMRRSAARTAMWEMNCTDATFSTVVSDLRRGLTDLTSSSSDEILPITFSDELPLADSVCSDFDLLVHHQGGFRHAPEKHRQDVVALLRGVRDLPFAGTSYMWPDLDGSTTRLVVTAVSAAQDLATWAIGAGDTEALMVSTTAGLRLLPGDEQLLDLQRSHLARR